MATKVNEKGFTNGVHHESGRNGSGVVNERHHPDVPVDTFEDGESDILEPIAIVGFAFEFADSATSTEDFWAMLMEGRCAMSGWPEDRLNFGSFYHPDGSRKENFPVKGAHFLKEPLEAFDAPFFSITSKEAKAMDPQHRRMLETAYKAFENSGIPLHDIFGSKTAVYTGCFSDDWKTIMGKDSDHFPDYHATGTSLAILANRISWFFNLNGPSVNFDSACSSSMVALDVACQGLRSKDSDIALVGGSNLLLSPDVFLSLSSMNFLSKDGLSYSFDSRANGYSRGEGNAAIILKRLPDAVANGDVIRAVIRATGSNQDGRTPGITQPSQTAQESLIRETYAKAGLSLSHTRYVEAHGTGTVLGDSTEAGALYRTFDGPLYVGSVKSNIGHLEGASGLAGLIKTVMILERGIIPPIANLESLNPEIEVNRRDIQFPNSSVLWPSEGLRRASVNSFGFGGSNAHAILEDAYHHLRLRHLKAYHRTSSIPSLQNVPRMSAIALTGTLRDPQAKSIDHHHGFQCISNPKLLVLSAFDNTGIHRMQDKYRSFFTENMNYQGDDQLLSSIAFTLADRRSYFPWRSFVLAEKAMDLVNETMPAPVQCKGSPRLGFIFTGQGAQYPRMGQELMSYSVFRSSIEQSEFYLCNMGCSWSLREELLQSPKTSRIDQPEYSQAICTAIQIALVDLLRDWEVKVSSVVGHSSGEIAAAYCIGALSHESACRVAYYRGHYTQVLATSGEIHGGMMAVGISSSEITKHLSPEDDLCVACINSPRNVTLSGKSSRLDELQKELENESIFAKRLKVDIPYHSSAMMRIAEDYMFAMGRLTMSNTNDISMFSSVTGEYITPDRLSDKAYWVENLVSQVNLLGAVESMLHDSNLEAQSFTLLEIGPHSALRVPIKEILEQSSLQTPMNTRYHATLSRGKPPIDTMLTSVGHLWSYGHNLKITRVNDQGEEKHPPLVDPPSYPFDHSKLYWHESRMSKEYRLRRYPTLDVLGTPVTDWNPLEARWRNFITLGKLPWIEDHKISGTAIYPASGFLVMAIEALKQLSSTLGTKTGFTLEDVVIKAPLVISSEAEGVETQIHLRSAELPTDNVRIWTEFRVFSVQQSQWLEHCNGRIRMALDHTNDIGTESEPNAYFVAQMERYHNVTENSTRPVGSDHLYDILKSSGFDYGPAFQAIHDLHASNNYEATATIRQAQSSISSPQYGPSCVIHPVPLDAGAQLMLAALSKGGLTTLPTIIPTRINRLYVASNIQDLPGNNEFRAYSKLHQYGKRKATSTTVFFDSRLSQVLLEMEMESTVVDNAPVPKSAQLCYSVRTMPDVTLMSSEQLQLFCNSRAPAHSPDPQRQALRSYLELALHKKPDMNILEVGSSPSSEASTFLDALDRLDNNRGSVARMASYMLTRRSSQDLEEVTSQIQHHEDLLEFKTLDLNADIAMQGFSSGTYDLILVQEVCLSSANEQDESINCTTQSLHNMNLCKNPLATTNGTIKSCHILNHPNGVDNPPYLDDDGPKGAHQHLCITSWNQALVQAGFSDLGRKLGNFEDDGAILYTATESSPIQSNSVFPSIEIITGENSQLQQEFTLQLEKHLKVLGASECKILSLAQSTENPLRIKPFRILVTDFDRPFLSNLHPESFEELKRLIIGSEKILWIAAGDAGYASPEVRMMEGFSRVLRNELGYLQLTTLILDKDASTIDRSIEHVIDVITCKLQTPSSECEPEYEVQNDILHIRRVLHDRLLTDSVRGGVVSEKLVSSSFRDGGPLKMGIGTPGLLDSLVFEGDYEAAQPLADFDVEVEVAFTGLNFRDCLAALGQIDSDRIGGECSGIVTRTGASVSEARVGDRVIVLGPILTFRTFVRCNESYISRIPDSIAFAEASAIPIVYTTAHYAFVEVARLQPQDTVLIHLGSGGTGQAAIQLARHLGVSRLFTTVGSQEKKQFLVDTYGIPEDHIFSSRTDEFANAIMRKTNGRGVDVVLNSLPGELLRASWSCIAPFGRFIEIGKRDVLEKSSLPMFHFGSNASFSVVDLGLLLHERPSLGHRSLRAALNLLAAGYLTAPTPLNIYGVGETEAAFRHLQSRKSKGKMVIEMRPNDVVRVKHPTFGSSRLDPDSTYIIAGGFGGLGRSIARWMASNGAKHLILLSRKGPTTIEAQNLVTELERQRITVEAPRCDIGDHDKLKEAIELCEKRMPPIRGCINSTMVIKDSFFELMKFDGWLEGVRPKVAGSWNLHCLLPRDLDFFIMLSSVSGITGFGAQTNYAAGNTYQDALARYRVSHGQQAVALDLGWMQSEGVIAGNSYMENLMGRVGCYVPIPTMEFYRILDIYCQRHQDPARIPDVQRIIGLESPAGMKVKGISNPPWMGWATFRHMDDDINSSSMTAPSTERSYEQLFRTAESVSDAVRIISRGLLEKLSKAMMVEESHVDTSKSLYQYGVDSLTAIELRNWAAKDLQADIKLFELMAEGSFDEVSMRIAKKSKFCERFWSQL
ncbi:ketoacyl-synt-domain-containing protein [Lophiostoma macrostomum CBS 122681]|uniref:Ketoacyl-synt-domain-containing protein n=1 Tax=Lophiostoma macrostomum CBS 122681 TaxID=1314788 RepID=A0A6A6T727_9PLEO|nr:ketoacyl-synt-domain-containing protein [Lophiostoma macrostomum CBS 122681]